MKNVLRIVAGLFGAFFLINGLQGIIAPANIAEQLGMPLLEGVGLSAQIGDMGSFFITVGVMTLIGVLTQTRHWFTRLQCYCWWQLYTELFQLSYTVHHLLCQQLLLRWL